MFEQQIPNINYYTSSDFKNDIFDYHKQFYNLNRCEQIIQKKNIKRNMRSKKSKKSLSMLSKNSLIPQYYNVDKQSLLYQIDQESKKIKQQILINEKLQNKLNKKQKQVLKQKCSSVKRYQNIQIQQSSSLFKINQTIFMKCRQQNQQSTKGTHTMCKISKPFKSSSIYDKLKINTTSNQQNYFQNARTFMNEMIKQQKIKQNHFYENVNKINKIKKNTQYTRYTEAQTQKNIFQQELNNVKSYCETLKRSIKQHQNMLKLNQKQRISKFLLEGNFEDQLECQNIDVYKKIQSVNEQILNIRQKKIIQNQNAKKLKKQIQVIIRDKNIPYEMIQKFFKGKDQNILVKISVNFSQQNNQLKQTKNNSMKNKKLRNNFMFGSKSQIQQIYDKNKQTDFLQNKQKSFGNIQNDKNQQFFEKKYTFTNNYDMTNSYEFKQFSKSSKKNNLNYDEKRFKQLQNKYFQDFQSQVDLQDNEEDDNQNQIHQKFQQKNSDNDFNSYMKTIEKFGQMTSKRNTTNMIHSSSLRFKDKYTQKYKMSPYNQSFKAKSRTLSIV